MIAILLISLVFAALVALGARLRVTQLRSIDEAPRGELAPSHGPMPSANVHGGLYDHAANERRGMENVHPFGYAPNEPHAPRPPDVHVGTVQTTQRLEDRVGRPGMVADGTSDGVSRIAEAAMRPGQLCLRGVVTAKAGKGVRPPFAAAAADPDGIKTNIASAAAPQTLVAADFNGAIGASRMVPARNVVLVLSSHANWDATTAIVTGEDEYGREITENLAIPDAGNATVTGAKVFSKITSLFIPTQSGTAGTATFGTDTLLGPITARDAVGFAQYLAARQIALGAATEFSAEDTLSVLEEGRCWVEVEEDVKDGEQVYMRLVAGGGETVGAYRNDRDGTAAAPDAVPLIGVRFVGDSTTDEDGTKVCRVQFDFSAS